MSDSNRRGRVGWLWPVVLLLLPILFLWKLTLAGRILVGLDPFNFFYPYHDAVRQALAAGRLPEWNPALFGGVPFLADSQAQLFYPPSWPFLLLSAPTALNWSVALHLGFAAIGLYLFARRALRLTALGAGVAALLFVLSGYLGAQIEHVNQLHAASWLPWLLLGYEMKRHGTGRRRASGFVLGALALAMSLLAGHAQTTFISLVLLGLWTVRHLWRDFARLRSELVAAEGHGLHLGQPAFAWRRYLSPPVVPLLLILSIGLLLAMIQLVPTQQLTHLSQRAGGLSLAEAAAFSLDPRVLPRALLPSYGLDQPLLSEYMAWFSISGALLALLGLLAGHANPTARDFGIMSSATGLLLALGGYNPLFWLLWRLVPGFDLFRVPARWLLLYLLGMAVLAGLGVDSVKGNALPRTATMLRRRWRGIALGGALLLALFLVVGAWPPLRLLPLWFAVAVLTVAWLWQSRHRTALRALIVPLLLAESWFGWQAFDLQNATAPEAYSDLRIAPTHLLASDRPAGSGRLLSMSDLTWDPGDLASLNERHAALLNEAARYDLVVSTKLKEILAPNQPMRWGLATADGYGGGLLPTERWVTLQPALPLAKIVPDGRLREQLTDVPSHALLEVMGVHWLVRDKLLDWWQRDIYHDLGVPLPIEPDVAVEWQTTMDEATALSFVVIGPWPAKPGQIMLGGVAFDLSTAEPLASRETPRGSEQHFWLPLEAPYRSDTLTLTGDDRWTLGGLTVVDERVGGFGPLVATPTFVVTSSGDVKVYERRDALGRAWLAPSAQFVATPKEAAAVVAANGFDPRRRIVVEGEGTQGASDEGATGTVQWLIDSAETLELKVISDGPTWLVIADAPAPGWTATIDGEAAGWLPANVINRALRLPAGEHIVRWQYQTPGLRLGVALSALALLLMLAIAASLARSGPRQHPTK